MRLGRHQWRKQTKMPRFMLIGPQLCTIFCFVFMNTLCVNYITKTFPLNSSSVSSKQLLWNNQGQKSEHLTKNFVEFHSYSPLLTML